MRVIRWAWPLIAVSSLLVACESSSKKKLSASTATGAIGATETIAAEPATEQKGQVTLAPPTPPAGPVPIPYPNVATAKEPAQKTSVSGKEVTLKKSTSFKQSSGD